MGRSGLNDWICRFLAGAFILTAGMIYMVCSCIEAKAEEIQVFREESGDLEQLQGVELSEKELEEGVEKQKPGRQKRQNIMLLKKKLKHSLLNALNLAVKLPPSKAA